MRGGDGIRTIIRTTSTGKGDEARQPKQSPHGTSLLLEFYLIVFYFVYRIVHRPTMPGCGAKGLALAFVSGTCELRGQPSRPPPPPSNGIIEQKQYTPL